MADPSTLKNPFVGLRAFEEDEDYLFFGRSAEINDLLKKFSNNRFLAVIGSSGSGKSSLVKSGLLPAIYSGFLSVGSNWRVVVFRPGNDPIGNMTKELAREGVLYENTSQADIPFERIIESTLRRSGGGVVQVYRQAHLPPAENLLIVIDQFEELFRFRKYEEEAQEGKSDALGFVNLILTATQQSDYPVYVLLTMRSDFLGDCAQFRGLPEAINEGQYLVPRMTRDEIREAITGPIAVGGATITTRLLTRLLNDVGNNLDQLPILQHAMMRTWDAWKKKNRPADPIDIPDYEKIGGMASALSLHADEAYSELTSDKQRLICELMFKALTDKAADVRGTRRPTSVSDLSILTDSSAGEVIKIVEAFRKPGRTFLMPPPGVPLDDKSIIDISHESIMRVWERLVKWTDEEAASADVYLRLSEDAMRYAEGKTDLWRNPELETGLKWYRANNPNASWAERYNQHFKESISFLLSSEEQAVRLQKEQERSTRNKRIAALVAIVVLTLFSIIAASLWRSAVNQKKIALIKTKEATDAKGKADSLKIVADTSAAKAGRDRAKAVISADLATAEKIKADSSAARASRAERDAKIQRDHAVAAQKRAQLLLNDNAAAEYQRLIREGPTEEDSIAVNHWNYKYFAYCGYLDSLKKLNAKNAVKKNDELYEKLYYSLLYGDNKIADEHFLKGTSKNNNQSPAGYVPEKFSSGSYQVSISNDTLFIPVNTKGNSGLSKKKISALSSNTKNANDAFRLIATEDNMLTILEFDNQHQILHEDSMQMPGKIKASAVAMNPIDKRILVATENNVLTVYKYDNQYALTPENSISIPMGGQVSALDYYDGKDVIFFGLKTGEIGFIKYQNKKERKNQPVYRNNLNSKITAVDFFTRDTSCYLLTTSIKGRAMVYELGSAKSTNTQLPDFLNENKKLTGIELPEYLGDIRSAAYQSGGRIQLVTSKGIWLWNPFVDELLAQLQKELNAGTNADTLKKVIQYSKKY